MIQVWPPPPLFLLTSPWYLDIKIREEQVTVKLSGGADQEQWNGS
jgi:hypothetical protein